MDTKTFRPRYTLLTWAILLLYATPWLYAAANVLMRRSGADWELFWLLSGTIWLIAGLLHMKEALLRRVTLGSGIEIAMVLQKPTAQRAKDPVRIRGDVAVFQGQSVHLRYLANAPDLMQMLVTEAGRGDLNLIYEQSEGRPQWAVERNLWCLIAFALYMAVMLGLRLRPLTLVGPATDALLLGWAVMLPVLLIVKLVRLVRWRLQEGKDRWT